MKENMQCRAHIHAVLYARGVLYLPLALSVGIVLYSHVVIVGET